VTLLLQSPWATLFALLIATAVGLFLWTMRDVMRVRRRPRLDWGLRHTMSAMTTLAIVTILGLWLSTGWVPSEELAARLAFGYGILALLGWISAMIIGLIKRRLTVEGVWGALVETGHITANILFLIIAASIYSRMLGIAGLPTLFGEWLGAINLTFVGFMVVYVLVLLALGTIIDTASIILIVVPLFLHALEPFNIDLVWFGIITVIGAEIGLLTPPFGISCFVIKATIDDPSIELKDIFMGAAPFAAVMLGVLVILIAFPKITLALV